MTGCGASDSSSDRMVATVYVPRYASGFRIDSLESGRKRLVVSKPWQGADGIELTFDLDSAYNRLATMSATHIAMLGQLDEIDRVVAVSSLRYLYDSSVKSRLSEDADFGYEGNIDYEKLLKNSPDLTLIYSTGGKSAMEGKLNELGLQYIYIGDYAEEDPLGKAEWMVLIGELTGNRLKAEKHFKEIEKNYLKEKSLSAKTLGGDDNSSKPLVMMNAPYGDSWFCPPSESYAVTLIRDAGGEYLLSDLKGNASQPIDMEKAIKLGEEADIWLNPGNVSSRSELKQNIPQLSDSKIIKEGRIYSNSARMSREGGNDYFETGTVRPDIVLRDLRLIMEGNPPDSSLFFFRTIK